MSEQAFKLIIEDDEGRRSVIPVELGEVSIGRLEANTIRLNERNVSRQHARIRKESAQVQVEDLGSYNGVYINGDRIKERAELREGDLIKIGDFHLELRGEGLQRRAEETTQRTMLPGDREATQPEIRMSDVEATAPGPQTPLIPNANRPIPAPRPLPQEGEKHEATAIIRLDDPALQAPKTGSATLAGEKAKLVCVSTQYAGREFEIVKTEMVIGRTDENDIAVDHRSVSRQHAKIVVDKNRYRLVDMKSANGTLVNGEEYAQTELKRGDLIELGHVKFRFVPAGDSYTLNSDEAAAVKAGRSGAPVADLSGGLPKAVPLPFLIGGGAIIVLLVVVLIAVVVSNDDTPQPQPQVAPGVAQPTIADPSMARPASGNTEIDGLLGRAQVAMSQRKWGEADMLAKAALTLDPQNAQAKEIANRVQVEMRAEQSAKAANDAIAGGDWSGAWRSLRDIPEQSVYRSPQLVEQVKGNYIAELSRHGNEALEREDWEKALSYADEISGIDPQNANGQQIRRNAEAGQQMSGGPRKGKQKEKEKEKEKAKTAGSEPTPPKPPPPAKTTGGSSGKDAKTVYGEGISLLKGGDLQAAISSFTQCVQIDPNFGLCYRALGIAYAKSGNGAKAARYYRQYLKVAPNAPDAEQVKQLLEQYETAP